MSDVAKRCGYKACMAISPDGKPVGFFCYSVNTKTNEGMLKFVMLDPSE